MQLTRRTFLQAMSAALKAAPYLSDWSKTVKDGNRPRTRPQVIDNADFLRKGMDWTGERLADMDAAGVDMQILSLGGFPQFAPKDKELSLAQSVNDRFAQTVADHPTRFAAFATLPWGQPENAVAELERAVKQLRLKGALLNGRPNDHFLDAPEYAELLAKFNELRVPLYLHPGIPVPAVQAAYYSGFTPELTARLSMFA
nr:amidohydrolase family protein [Neisseria bacilliformis]